MLFVDANSTNNHTHSHQLTNTHTQICMHTYSPGGRPTWTKAARRSSESDGKMTILCDPRPAADSLSSAGDVKTTRALSRQNRRPQQLKEASWDTSSRISHLNPCHACMHACMHGHAHSDMRINTQARVCTRAHPHVPTEDKYAWGTLSKTCPWTCVFARRIHIHSHACILHAEIDWTDGWLDGHIGHLRHITKDSPAARLANEDTQASR